MIVGKVSASRLQSCSLPMTVLLHLHVEMVRQLTTGHCSSPLIGSEGAFSLGAVSADSLLKGPSPFSPLPFLCLLLSLGWKATSRNLPCPYSHPLSRGEQSLQEASQELSSQVMWESEAVLEEKFLNKSGQLALWFQFLRATSDRSISDSSIYTSSSTRRMSN